MRIPFVLLIALSACGYHNPLCDDPDLTLSGLCVHYNGHEDGPNERQLTWTVAETQSAVNEVKDKGRDLNLPALLSDAEASLTYMNVPLINPDDGTEVRGMVASDDIYLGIRPQCLNDLYVLSHEMMHIIAEEYLSYSHTESNAHDVPHLFLEQGCKTCHDGLVCGDSCTISVESIMWFRAWRYCQSNAH